MATKSKKQKKQEQERKARVNKGGQSIAKIAKQETGKRQQQSFDQKTKDAGINKQYSYKDQIAQTAVKEIGKRQKLSSWLEDLNNKKQATIEKNQQIVDRAMRWSMPGAEKKAERIHQDLTGAKRLRETSTSKRLSDDVTKQASVKAKEIAKAVAENDKAAKATGTKWLEEQRASGKSTISTKGAAGSTATVKSGTQSGLGYAGKTVTKDILGTVLPAAGAGKASTGTKGSTAQATGKKTGSMPYASQDQLQKEWDKLLNRKQQEYEAYQNQINQLDVDGKYGMLAGDEKSSFWKGPVNKDTLQQLMSQQAKSNKPFSKDMDTLHKEKKQYKTELDEVNARIKAEQDRLAALGPKTTDELMADSEEWNKLNAYQNKISELSDHGLDITPNNALGIQGQTRIKNKPADYYDSFGNETDRSLYYDAALYDAIHGNGAYEQIYNNGTDEDFDKVNNEVEDLWKRLENGTLMDLARNGEQAKAKQDLTVQMQGSSAELQTAQAQARAIQKQLDEANREIESQRDYYAYMLQFQNPEKAGYIPENDRGIAGTGGYSTESQNIGLTDDVHRIYSFINGGIEYQRWLSQNGYTAETAPVTNRYSKTALMMPNEIDAFNSFYNQGKYEEAKAFLSALQPYLNQRYAPYESVYIQERAKQDPVSASYWSLVEKQANTFIDIPRHIAGWLGDKSVKDYNSDWYSAARESEISESTIANEIGGFGGKAYSNIMNSLSNLARGLMAPKGSKLVQSIVGLGTFFLQVDQEATARYLKDHKYEDAEKLGAIDAAFEVAEEFLPFETMLGTEGKGLGISMLLNSLSEAGQEFVGATLFEKIKGIITGEDSEQERIDEILYRGSYIDRNGNEVKLSEDPEVALQQARTQAGKEFWQAAAENAAAGFFGGALGGTYGTIAQATGMSRTGKAISSERNNQQGKTGLQRILELGAGMKEGTKSQEIAAKLQAKVESGKKVSDFQLGNLAQTIAEETGEQQGAVIKDTVQRVIRGQLEAKGVGREAAGTYADVIATAMVENKGKLNKAARSVLAKDQRAIDVWKSYNSAGSAEEMAASLKNQMELEKEVTKETAPQRSIMDTLGTLATDKSIVTGAMSAEVQRAVSSTKSDAEAIDYLAKNNSSLMSEEYAEEAKRLLESDPQAKQTKSFVDDVMKIRMAAMSLMETAPATNLSEETANDLFEKAKKEFEDTDKLRIQRSEALEPGKGVATFDGAEYGTDAWKEKTKQFSKTVRNQMGAVALIAKQFGHTVNFINDENRNMVNGWQSEADGSITINAATGMKHSMLATVTHEMTHWLEHNSEEGYAQLRQFIVDNLRANGKNVEQMLMDTIRNQERVRQDEISRLGQSEIASLSISDAMAELVAKSSEDILTSQAMKEAIAKANPNLYTKVKNFVRDVIARIDSALRATEQFGTSAEAYALRNVRDQIAEMWLGAREDALGNSGETEQATGVKKQMSISERKQTIDLDKALKNPDAYKQYFTYNNLIKKDPIELTDLTANNVNTTGMNKAAEKNAILAAGIQNATANGRKDENAVYVRVGDTGTDVKVTNKGLRHSYENNDDYKEVVEHVGELLKGSVLINTASGRETDQTGTYILLGAGVNSKGKLIYSAFHVNRYSHEIDDVDILYSIEERAAASMANKSVKNLLLTAPNVSIAKALNDVKKSYAHILPIDVMNRLGAQRRVNKNTPFLQHSVAQMDEEYEEARTIGDNARMREIVDESARRAGYIPVTRYHQTGEKFTEFKTDNPVAGATDSETPNGIFFKDNDHDIGVGGDYVNTGRGGDVQMPVYLKHENMLHFKDRKEAVAWYKKNVPGYQEARDTWDNIYNEKYKPQFDAIDKEMFDPETTEDRYAELEKQEENLIKELGEEERQHHKAMRELLNQYFLKGNSQYDGIELDYDGHRYIDGKRENVHTYIVFNPEQVKSADMVTYDDNGIVIKPSERFNDQKKDIRWSVAQMDAEYADAVESGNVQAQKELVYEAADRAMKDTKARYDDGELITVYHGTDADFNVFDTNVSGGAHGKAEGFGIYLTDRKEISDKYGSRKISGYLNTKRMAYGDKTTIKKNELVRVIRKACEQQADTIMAEDGYSSRSDALKDTWVSNYVYTLNYNSMERVYADVADLILEQNANDSDIIGEVMAGMGIREYNEAIDFYHNILTPETGIDSISTKWYNYDGELVANIFLAFDSSQIKSADAVTYDDDGQIIPLSERFNDRNKDIRYSVIQEDVKNDDHQTIIKFLPGNTVSATQYSLSSYFDLGERTKMMKALKKAGYSEEEIDKWMQPLTSIAVRIMSNRAMYDYVADRSKTFLKENGDVYKKTLDANTMCKKTRLYNGTFNVVQHLMPHTILMPEDLIDLYNIMKDRDLETPCGFCYVQSRRRLLGQYTEEWLKDYQGEYIPNVDEVTTSDGLEKLKIDHPQTYKDFVDAMNKKGVNNPKLVQQRTDYRGEIRKMRKSTIDYLKRIGGLRIQSFSDFETVHMLDMMQAVIDMKAMGLTAQAYTKVPEFAWIFGRTGIKINLSLVGKGTGLDANGQLVFDDSEGINSAEAFRLRDAYSKNVGTILVGINDDHIITAMGDSRIDFIIPFHKSGWSKNELEHMRGLEHYEDYTADQNEYDITGRDEEGNLITVKAESNLDPLSYWDFSKNGEYNARKYLQICKEQKIQPKFTQFLTDNGDGSWSLPEGNDQRSTNIREGYWKTLIDFKMYDNDGIGAKQELVQPNFNMEAANRILYEYDGSHRELPEDWAAAEEFVEMYKKNHPLDNVRTQYSVEQAPDMDVQRFMLGLDEHHMNTEQERVMLRQFKELRGGIDAIRFRNEEREKQIREIEAKKETSVYDREKLRSLRNIQQNEENRLARMEKELIRVTSDKGYAKLMYKNAKMMSDLVTGRSAEDVQQTVRAMNSELDNVTKEMAERAERLRTLAEKEAVLRIRQQFDRAGLKRIASALKKNTGSSLANETIENRLALIALKMKQGEFDKENTQELAELLTGGIKSDYDSYIIDTLRGSTITLSPVQLKELKGQNRTLADVRRELAGTGIRIGTKGNVTLDGKWDELCDMIPSLDREETATKQLDALLGVIRSEKNATYTGYGTDENMMAVSTKVLEAARDLIPEIVTDEKSLKLIKETLEFVQTMSAEARGSAEAMTDIGNLIGNLQKKSAAATGAAEKLTGDVKDAIEYFNELSKQSEAAIWKRERSKLIEQLKSENTMNILMEQEKWKKRIERDKTAREMRESNLQLRKRISTNYGRIRKLILAETDQQNVPEYMKSLARFMLDKITTNDLLSRKLTGFNPRDLAETKRVLDIMREQDGDFSIDDLRMIDDEEAQAAVADALADLEDGLGFYNATPGKDLISNLQAYRNSLERISDAVTTITNVINAERSLSFWNRKMDVADAAKILMEDMRRKKNRKELAGAGSKQLRGAKYTVTYGNETPVYFFKNLKNRGMDMQWEEMTHAENRNGLEVQKAKDAIGAIADKTGYKNWAGEKHKVTLGGFAREISIENMMELYAIWKREQTTNPEMSQHLNKGGVFIQDNANEEGRLRMEERKQQKAFRVTDEEIQAMYDKMTDAQKEYLDGIVSYLSNEMSALGNEASMRMYGIKKYKESYYFPMKVWDGVKSARSDKGITGTDENRAAHKSWSKRRKNMAKNALVIGNFTQDAVNHIVEMINYNTMAPAIENINKILNYQVTEGLNQDEATSRNMRVMFEETYGRDALKYLEELMKDMNGGAVQDQRRTLRDRALSMFKKNAVAGSASVALQQPLSYIRAAMMINPKYLARAISPNYWKGSYEEMNRHSGVAVIKDMGRFDMNFGQSAKDFITPETGKNLYGKVSDLLTKAPELMDRMTWTRMWTACKLEQKAMHPEMDVNSDAFLNMVGKRFNEVMRRTQVYDSVLVKSSNMRSQNLGMKVLTSFMAEPTLSLNVLADAVRNVREKGGLETLGKAGATFMLSAICQSLVKGLMGSGRTPDDKKTWWENFLNKWYTAFLSEANPFGLVPGYSDIVELIKNGELQDDAMGAVGKIFSVIDRIGQMADGKGKGVYRDIEDTAAQLAQLFTNIPAKNLMRDARAMYNWITQEPYAKRDSSSAVIKYQTEAGFWNADTLISAINKKLGDAGFQANNKEYYSRIYNAMKNGNEREAEELREYLELGKGVKPESIDSGIKSAAKDDADMTDAEKSSWMIDKGMMNKLSDVTGQYKDGKLTKPEATKLMKQMDPEITDDEIYWKLDQIDYRNETGAEKTPTGYNYRLKDAINANKAEDIRTAIDAMLKHGFTKEKIKKDYLGDWKNEYQQADADGRRKIRDALEKAYKALGYTAEDADKVIDKWTEEKKKKDSSSKPSGIIASLVSGKGSKETQDRIMWDSLYRNTEGEAYGKGNIDLNKRQVVKNKDGSISTEKSFSFWDEDEGKEILIPTVINGKIVSEDEAIDHYYQTGEYLGKFDTWQEADEYAEKLHDRQDWYYHR